MIKYTPSSGRTLALFQTPFEQKLSAHNRWVRMAALVPWDEMAKVLYTSLSTGEGRPTVDLRIILGALLVKYIEDLSDEDTIQYIQENIYAQYFVGLSSFQTEPVFVPSLFVEVRKRLDQEGSAKLNDLMIRQARDLKVIKHRRNPSDDGKNEEQQQQGPEGGAEQSGTESNNKEQVENRGTLMVDATVAPLHIAFPTDTRLLSEGRRYAEQLIDRLYYSHPELWKKKPRTYRREAKKAFVSFSKSKRRDTKAIRKATGQQLRYLRRDLVILNKMLDGLEKNKYAVCWTQPEWRKLWIIQELYRQQEEMFRDRRRRIDDRIISIQQPHARPIKRGKGGGKDTEFGPKVNISLSEGIARADQIDFNAFNEAICMEDQIEGFKELHGYYPAVLLADQIFWTRSNRKYLKERSIQIGGVPLGPSREMSKYEKYKARKRNNKRSEVEGKFGQAKLKYGLDNLFTRLPETTKAEINLIFLAINLLKIARTLFDSIFNFFFRRIGHLMDYLNCMALVGEKRIKTVTGIAWNTAPKLAINPA